MKGVSFYEVFSLFLCYVTKTSAITRITLNFFVPLRPFMRRLMLFIAMLLTALPHVRCEDCGATCAAAGVDSTLRISLLTCTPGPATYELYGHTAIRVYSAAQGIDNVYNYGVFNFDQPHFTWHFVLGQTDYMVLPCGMSFFMQSYVERGSAVYEQELNLTPAEAQRLADTLQWNVQLKNRIYRYNIFRRNCTTMSRDIIEACVDGHVDYPPASSGNTFRTILHQYADGREWSGTGNDLLLGSNVDTLLSTRDEQFAPLYMMRYMDSATVVTPSGEAHPLVRCRRTLLEEDAVIQAAAAATIPSFPVGPRPLFYAFLVLCLALCLWEWHSGRLMWGFDALLMLLQGLAGVLLTFMALCSEHPGVTSNWQIVVFNPLALLGLPFAIHAARRCETSIYYPCAAVVLAMFIVTMHWLPQVFSVATLPLALALLSRAISNIAVPHKYHYNR